MERYFFWLENGYIEIYDNGQLQRYGGEKQCCYRDDIEGFWKRWEDNSAFVENGSVDFIFAGEDADEVERVRDYCEERYNFSSEEPFTFEELETVISDKELDEFCIDTGKDLFYMQRIGDDYEKIPDKKGLKKIYVAGSNIGENFLIGKNMAKSEPEIREVSKVESPILAFCQYKLSGMKANNR